MQIATAWRRVDRLPVSEKLSQYEVGGVYDPFVGSGTTIIAAETIGRVCYAIDIDPIYVDVAVQRWQAFSGKDATLEDGGRTFDQIGAMRKAA